MSFDELCFDESKKIVKKLKKFWVIIKMKKLRNKIIDLVIMRWILDQKQLGHRDGKEKKKVVFTFLMDK